MTLADFQDYLPLGDLAKIVIACLAVALVAPAAVAVAISGLDQRTRRPSSSTGAALVAVGALVVAALIAAGLYALFTD
jgi:hypothetical protein